MLAEPAAPPQSPEVFDRLLKAALPAFRLELEGGVVAGLAAYLTELDRWRRTTNLTGNLTSSELALHALESLVPLPLIDTGKRLVDIGSGAGFPGVPLAIARPDLAVTLVEPRRKRCAFLRHVVRALALSGVSVLEARIEEVGGQTFGVATTRAVVRTALRYDELLEPSGFLLAWTTSPASHEQRFSGLLFDREIVIPRTDRRVVALFRRAW